MSDILHQKVLIRWVPSETLRRKRTLLYGAKWGAEVQQVTVKADTDPELFARAVAVAPQTKGYTIHPEIHVGFKGDLRYSDVGWFFVDGTQTVTRTWDENPTIEQLLSEFPLTPEQENFRLFVLQQINEARKTWELQTKADLDREVSRWKTLQQTLEGKDQDEAYAGALKQMEDLKREGKW